MSRIGRNDPCPCGSGKKYKRCCLGKGIYEPVVEPAPASAPMSGSWYDDPLPFAPRDDLARDVLPLLEPKTPLERANAIILGSPFASRKERIKMAREALAISSDCALAYLVLSIEEARSPTQALPLCEQALAAAERALGPNTFTDFAGQFGEVTETIPYMESRLALAKCLHELGRGEESIEHLRALIELDPLDNAGAAVHLAHQLIAAGQDQEANELVVRFSSGDSAGWMYDRALVKFRLLGDGIMAQRALSEARRAEPTILSALLGKKRTPKKSVDLLELSVDAIADLYIEEAGHLWTETPGAIEWARTTIERFDAVAGDETIPRTGPRLVHNRDPFDDVYHCPECDQPLTDRTVTMVLLVEPNYLGIGSIPAKWCEECDLLVAHEPELHALAEASLRAETAETAEIGTVDYSVLGLVDDELPPESEGPPDADWIIAHLKMFREEWFDDLADFPDDLAWDGFDPIDDELATEIDSIVGPIAPRRTGIVESLSRFPGLKPRRGKDDPS